MIQAKRMILDGLTVMSHCYPMFTKGDPSSVLWLTFCCVATFRFILWVAFKWVDLLVRLVETVCFIGCVSLGILVVLYLNTPTQCETSGILFDYIL